jgi:hypothetical protein
VPAGVDAVVKIVNVSLIDAALRLAGFAEYEFVTPVGVPLVKDGAARLTDAAPPEPFAVKVSV